VYQHLEYFAFGETFVEEHSNTWRTPYLFNGKELDDETGLYYYGARYYDPVTNVWASVDQMADKYPHMSPFVYCFNNPIRFNDPTGMDGDDPQVHQIKKGETLYSISKKYGTTVENLQNLNNIKGTLIIAGKTLKVPGTSTAKNNTQKANNGTSTSTSNNTTQTTNSSSLIMDLFTRKGGITLSSKETVPGASEAGLPTINTSTSTVNVDGLARSNSTYSKAFTNIIGFIGNTLSNLSIFAGLSNEALGYSERNPATKEKAPYNLTPTSPSADTIVGNNNPQDTGIWNSNRQEYIYK
jgi:RHS repeat-associated protein